MHMYSTQAQITVIQKYTKIIRKYNLFPKFDLEKVLRSRHGAKWKGLSQKSHGVWISACRAQPKDEWLYEVMFCKVCHRPEYLNCQNDNYLVHIQVYLIGPEGSG